MVVSAYDEAGTLRSAATTDSSGGYSMTLPAGAYRVLAYDPAGAYATAFDGQADSYDSSLPVVVPGSGTVRIDFALVRGGTIRGQVTGGQSRTPLAAAVVEAYNLSGTRRGFASTAADGTYSLVVPPGAYKVLTYDPLGVFATRFHRDVSTFAEATPVGVTAEGSETVNFQLERAATVRGIITEAGTQTPLAGVRIYAYTPGGLESASTRSDPDGAFKLVLTPGEHRFAVADPLRVFATMFFDGSASFQSATTVALKAGELRNDLRVTLPRAAIIAGRVTEAASGTGLGNLAVAAYNPDGSLHVSTVTEADGRYSLAVAPNAYRIAAFDPAYAYATEFHPAESDFDSATAIHTVAGQQVTGIDLTLPRAGRVIGRAKTAGNLPVEGITIAAYDAAARREASATTAANGTYSLAVAPGLYRLLAYDSAMRYAHAYAAGAASYDEAVPMDIAVDATVSVDFTVRTGIPVHGTVVDPSARPISGVEIRALDLAGNRVATTTSRNGTFALTLSPATYKFAAVDPTGRRAITFYDRAGDLAGATAVTVSEGSVPPPITIVVEAIVRRRAIRH